MAEYVESKEKSQKTTLDTQKAKLAALEKQLGIQTSSSTATGLGAATSSNAPEAGSSQNPSASKGASSASAADVDVTKIAQKRHRFEDNQYFETSREINDGVRSAVTAGMYFGCFPSLSRALTVYAWSQVFSRNERRPRSSLRPRYKNPRWRRLRHLLRRVP